jgi:hypothetical protein
MLGTTSNVVIAQLIWQYWEIGLVERVAGVSVALIGFLVLLVAPVRYYVSQHQSF